ncbi:hypothetical protein ACIQWA_33120 [Kitasatospora sp. NPDC098652]|uniref:hypothetical protein n=1 Tax=Kitasatospora sp. NPDC098652 TaxID=3364095 RepID=UPI00382A9246
MSSRAGSRIAALSASAATARPVRAADVSDGGFLTAATVPAPAAEGAPEAEVTPGRPVHHGSLTVRLMFLAGIDEFGYDLTFSPPAAA